jgi:hypothetical protein
LAWAAPRAIQKIPLLSDDISDHETLDAPADFVGRNTVEMFFAMGAELGAGVGLIDFIQRHPYAAQIAKMLGELGFRGAPVA